MTIGADGMQRIRKLEAEVARLRQALDDYGEHNDNCMDYSCLGGKSCSCGLDAARQRPATDGKDGDE